MLLLACKRECDHRLWPVRISLGRLRVRLTLSRLWPLPGPPVGPKVWFMGAGLFLILYLAFSEESCDS